MFACFIKFVLVTPMCMMSVRLLYFLCFLWLTALGPVAYADGSAPNQSPSFIQIHLLLRDDAKPLNKPWCEVEPELLAAGYSPCEDAEIVASLPVPAKREHCEVRVVIPPKMHRFYQAYYLNESGVVEDITSFVASATSPSEKQFDESYELLKHLAYPGNSIVSGGQSLILNDISLEIILIHCEDMAFFRQKYLMPVDKCPLHFLYLMSYKGDAEAEAFLEKMEQERGVKVLNVLYNRLFCANNYEADSSRYRYIGFELQYMPAVLRKYWLQVIRQNMELSL